MIYHFIELKQQNKAQRLGNNQSIHFNVYGLETQITYTAIDVGCMRGKKKKRNKQVQTRFKNDLKEGVNVIHKCYHSITIM